MQPAVEDINKSYFALTKRLQSLKQELSIGFGEAFESILRVFVDIQSGVLRFISTMQPLIKIVSDGFANWKPLLDDLAPLFKLIGGFILFTVAQVPLLLVGFSKLVPILRVVTKVLGFIASIILDIIAGIGKLVGFGGGGGPFFGRTRAAAANFPSFATGTGIGGVPNSGLFFLHKDEEVINRRLGEQPFRNVTNNDNRRDAQITINVTTTQVDVSELIEEAEREQQRLQLS